MNQQIKIQLLHPNAVLPTKANATDAAFDLVAVTRKVVENGYIEYGFGLAFEVPEGWVALIYPRSSVTNTDLHLSNGVGVVDSGYRGEVKARFRAIRGTWISDMLPDDNSVEFIKPRHWAAKTYAIGERVAQVVFQKLPDVTLVQADSLSDSQRGTGGFGSSGR